MATIDPSKMTGKQERQYRRENPYSDYAKKKEMRYLNQISDMRNNNSGVSDAQVEEFNRLKDKWNYQTSNKPDVPQFNQEDYLNKITEQINSIYDKQQEARLGQLQASRDKAIGQINQQKAEVKPMYANKRNQADIVSHQNVQKLREIMASQGLTGSGENVTAMTGANAQRQGALNSLNLQEQQTMNDLNRRIADLNDPSQAQAIMAALDAERAKAMYDAINRTDDRAYQVGRDRMSDYYNDRNFDYRQGRDDRRDAEWESEQKWNRAAWEKEFNRNNAEWESQQKADRAWREYTYNNMSAAEKAQLEWAKQQFGEDMAWKMYDAEQNRAYEDAYNQAMLDAMNGNFNSGGGGGWNAKHTAWMPSVSSGDFKVSSGWGANEKFRGGDQHGGVDFAVPENTPMASTVNGKVIHSGWTDGGFGNYVAIQDSNGNTHIFGHLKGVNVKEGQTVSRGDIVGRSGNTGRSTGPHLHYEVRRGGIGGTPINPNPWIG